MNEEQEKTDNDNRAGEIERQSSAIPEETAEKILRDEEAILSIMRQSSFSGPLPPPQILEKYESIVPGSADRIIGMAEKQSEHRRSIEKKVVNSNVFNEKLGIAAGFIIGMTGLICATILGLNGAQTVAGIIGGASLTGLVGTFIYGVLNRRKELSSKKQD